jgi:hypothetical protein
MARRERLTKQERKLVSVVAAHPDATLSEAGKKASYKNPAVSAWRALRREPVQKALEEKRESLRDALLRRGMDEDRWASELDKGMKRCAGSATHVGYLDRLQGGLGHSKDAPPVQNNIFLALQEAKNRGWSPAE